MKKSKILSLFLALTLMISVMLPMTQLNTSATGTATITVNKPENLSIDGQTFKAYKIFDVTNSGANYAYTIADNFASFTALHDTLTALAADNADPDAVAEATMGIASDLWAYIDANAVSADGSATAGTGAASVTITGLDSGYYLVYGSGKTADGATVYGAANLTTTVTSCTITPKMDVPSIDKQVWDHNLNDGTGGWNNWTDVNIGDTVQFRVTSAVPVMTGYKSYIFTVHDVMGDGLTLDEGSVTVTVGGNDATGDYILNAAETGAVPADGCTFEIVFAPDKFAACTPGSAILITYSAELNDQAVIGSPGNLNTASLEYSSNPYTDDKGKTPDVTCKVFTFELSIFKYTDTGDCTNTSSASSSVSGASSVSTATGASTAPQGTTTAPDDFDLALAKFVTGIERNGSTINITTQTPVLQPGGYNPLPKPPLILAAYGDVVIFTIRVYNQGSVNGTAGEITDYIPNGFQFVPYDPINQTYGWYLDTNGNAKTNYLSNVQIMAWDSSRPYSYDYKDVQIALQIIIPTRDPIRNIAGISAFIGPDWQSITDINPSNDQDYADVGVAIFDLSLTKNVSQVNVTVSGKSTAYNYTGTDKTPIPISVTDWDNTSVRVTFKIEVTNEGTIPGYATEIIDYLPPQFIFQQADNPTWMRDSGSTVTTNSLQNTLLQPGDTAAVYITLQVINGVDGFIMNTAEINKDYNDYGLCDVDSTPGNNKPGEDDYDYAIVSIEDNGPDDGSGSSTADESGVTGGLASGSTGESPITSGTDPFTSGTSLSNGSTTVKTDSKCGKTGLPGAEFELHRNSENGPLVPVELTASEGVYRVTKPSKVFVTTITSPSSGLINVRGLDAGVYYLIETKAPDGYNKLKTAIKIEIVHTSGDGIAAVKMNGITIEEIDVLNNSGSVLPETGGIGATIFYVIGTALTILLVVFFVISKKKKIINK